MTDALCELRQDGKGTTPQAESLARGIKEKLNDLRTSVASALVAADKAGTAQTAHTVTGRLEQANKWLLNPQHDDRGLGQRAIAMIIHEGKKVADGLPGIHKAEILQLCDEVDNLSHQLANLCAHGQGNTPRAQEIARQLSQKLYELKNRIQQAVVSRVVEDFIDITTPLKQFTEAVLTVEGTPGREQNFNDKTLCLQNFSNRAAKTARMVAAGGSGGNKKLAEALLNSASQVESLTPQLINAGRIRMSYPQSVAADEHFENLRQQYAETMQRTRALCDEATDSADFVRTSEEQMQKHTFLCEDAIVFFGAAFKREEGKACSAEIAVADIDQFLGASTKVKVHILHATTTEFWACRDGVKLVDDMHEEKNELIRDNITVIKKLKETIRDFALTGHLC